MSLAAQSQQWCPTSVQVTVLQARGLRIKGKNGTNDAYAVMQVAKDKYATSVVEKSVAPVWEEEAAFDLPPVHPGSSERCTLHVSVLHRALVGPDKLLGQAAINLWELSEDKSRNKTEWFKLLGKTGKADKDRGEVLLYIQFMRNNMTASMFDLSASDKPRSRLGKFKDKVRGKKKEGLSDASSTVVPSVTQVLTDSEEEEGPGDANGEGAAGKEEKKKKHKLKSLFSQKSNLQRNMSQSMSILPEKNSALSSSISSGLNVDSSEGKKKFKFKIHKRSGSSGGKGSQGPLSNPLKEGSAVEQSNLCINGSHIYCEEPQPRSSRTSSNFSLSSSGHGSMEELRRTQIQETSATSIDSLRTQRQCSPWTEEEESKRAAEEEEGIMEEEEERETLSKKEQESVTKIEEEVSIIDEQWEKRQLEEDKMILAEQEKRRIEEEDKIRREEQERIRMEEKRAEEERRRKQEEERVRKQREENERLAEEKRRLEEEERRRIEEEEKNRQEQERMRMEKERAEEERKRRQEEEERLKKEEEERKRLVEEKRRLEEEERMRIEEEEKMRREEQERIRIEKERAEEERKRRQEEEERLRKQKEENERLAEEKRRLEEEERRRIEEEKIRREEERIRIEKERAEEERKRRQEEEERVRKEVEERKRLIEEKRRLEEERMRTEEEERNRQEQERIRMEEERAEEERKRKQEAEERARKEQEEERKRLAEEKRLEEGERRRIEEEEKMRREEQERIRIEKERAEEERKRRHEEEERLRKQKEENERLAEEKRRLEEEERRRFEEEEKNRQEQERIRMEKERAEEERKRRQEEEERLRNEEEERTRLAEEKRRLEEEERRRIEEEEKTRQEQERIRMENERAEEERKRRREEEERARKRKEENERLAEEKRKQEEEEKLREEGMKEEMRLRDEEERQKRVEEEKRLRQQEEERREREKASEAEEEMVSVEEKQGQKDEQIGGVKRREQEQSADETRVDLKLKEVTSTNPFDDDYSTNPFDEIPTSPAGPHSRTAKVSAVQPRYHSTVGSKEDLSLKETVHADEKDHIHAQRDKRPAPQPPGRKRPETQFPKEQNVSTPHQTQTNNQTRNKDVKTSSVFPQRLVQMITPLNRSSSTKKGGQMPESQSSTQPDCTPSTTEAPRVAKHNKGPAPFRPQSSRVGGNTLKQAGEDVPSCEPKGASSSGANQKDTNITPVVYGSNPFEDDESETELPTSDNADSTDSCSLKGSSSSNAGSLNSTAAARQTPDEDAASQIKSKSSKMARAPLPPAQKTAPSGTLESQNTDQGLASKSQGSVTDVAVPDNSVTKGDNQQSSETRPVTMQGSGLDAGGKGEGPPTAPRRLHPVKPLNPLEQQPASVTQEPKDNKSPAILSGGQEKVKVNEDGLKGPYTQLTQEELISLVMKQDNMLLERDKTISQLEQYIDNLLVRVMEEQPSILMSVGSVKRGL